jgi:hypothetical protein
MTGVIKVNKRTRHYVVPLYRHCQRQTAEAGRSHPPTTLISMAGMQADASQAEGCQQQQQQQQQQQHSRTATAEGMG